MKNSSRGRFGWYELMTDDVDAAKAFYTSVIGWEIEVWDEGERPYSMWKGPQGPLGGVWKMPQEAKDAGARPMWMGHLLTMDVDATAKLAEKLGGKVLVPASDIPKVGRFAVIEDPNGAAFSAFKPSTPETPESSGAPGTISWNQLLTDDVDGSFAFYSELFGWKKDARKDVPHGVCQMYKREGPAPAGGILSKPPWMKGPTQWLFYMTVADLDSAIAKVKEAGGSVLNGPMDIPDTDRRAAQLLDAEGVAFGLFG